MDREIIIHNAAVDLLLYRRIKTIIGNLGYGGDTRLCIKGNDKDLKLIIYDMTHIGKIKKALIENKINATYVEIG